MKTRPYELEIRRGAAGIEVTGRFRNHRGRRYMGASYIVAATPGGRPAATKDFREAIERHCGADRHVDA